MEFPKGNYRHYIQLYMKGIKEPFAIEVPLSEVDRLKRNISDRDFEKIQDFFFICNSLKGKSYAFNLGLIQHANILWEPIEFFEGPKRYEGPIEIYYKDRENSLETDVLEADSLAELFVILEHGPKTCDEYFYLFLDGDGEQVIVQLLEIICVVGPTHLLDEGFKMYFDTPDES